jgi:hypothetical protein
MILVKVTASTPTIAGLQGLYVGQSRASTCFGSAATTVFLWAFCMTKMDSSEKIIRFTSDEDIYVD